MKKKKPDPEMIDDDNPEWTEEEFHRARPASEVLYEIFPAHVADALMRPRGRPRQETTLQPVSVRLDPEVVAAFKRQGKGWSGRINAVLLAHVRNEMGTGGTDHTAS